MGCGIRHLRPQTALDDLAKRTHCGPMEDVTEARKPKQLVGIIRRSYRAPKLQRWPLSTGYNGSRSQAIPTTVNRRIPLRYPLRARRTPIVRWGVVAATTWGPGMKRHLPKSFVATGRWSCGRLHVLGETATAEERLPGRRSCSWLAKDEVWPRPDHWRAGCMRPPCASRGTPAARSGVAAAGSPPRGSEPE